MFPAKKEVFAWIKEGKKTVDVRKGNPAKGGVAVIQCGNNYLRLHIVKKETGTLSEVIRTDNFQLVIPSAATLEEALGYLRGLYGADGGVFTAYYLANEQK